MHKPPTKPEGTDWERVKREAAQDAPITHTAADSPHDPNDAAAVAAYWQQASIKRGRGRPATAVKRPTQNMHVDADVLEAFKATGAVSAGALAPGQGSQLIAAIGALARVAEIDELTARITALEVKRHAKP